MPPRPGNRTDLRVGGDLSGQVVIGDQNTVNPDRNRPDDHAGASDPTALRAALTELQKLVQAAGGEEAETALRKLHELETAILAGEPDLETIGQVRGWFGRHMPALAGKVNQVVLSPFLAATVAASGGALAAEFARLLGA